MTDEPEDPPQVRPVFPPRPASYSRRPVETYSNTIRDSSQSLIQRTGRCAAYREGLIILQHRLGYYQEFVGEDEGPIRPLTG